MNYRAGWILGLVFGLGWSGTTLAQGGIILDRGGLGGNSAWGMGGAGGMQFDSFLMTLTQLNMSPEFTLDKEAKQKLQALREEYRAAQTKYFTDHRLDMEKLQKEMMEAYKSRDVDDIKMAQKKMQEFQAAGVKAEDYVAKAKATLTPEQLKFVEERQAKAEQDRAAAMTRVKEMQERQNGAGGNPRAPEGKAPGNGGL